MWVTSKRLFIGTIGLCILFGCGYGEKKHDESIVLKAYRLIDEQRTDEAIELLERELESDTENYEYIVTLASAYAHKAGIKIQKLVPVINSSRSFRKVNADWGRINRKKSNSLRVNKVAIYFSELLSQFSAYFNAYSTIPIVKPKNIAFIYHAIHLFNSLGDRIKSEDALYRAVLQAILFKHIFAENFIGELVESKNTKTPNRCSINIGSINDDIIELGKLLIDIIGDLKLANPKQFRNSSQMIENVANKVSDLTLITTSVIVFDEASNIFLHQSLVQQGLGKIIKCGDR